MRYTWLRLLVGMAPMLACELDIQLDRAEPTTGPGTADTIADETSDAPGCHQSDPASRFLLAVQLFENGPPLQFSMTVFCQVTYEGSLSIIGSTRRLRPQNRRAYGDADQYGGPALDFDFVLEPAEYWTIEGSVWMTLILHGDVIDEDFICGHAEVVITEPPNKSLGAMTFAAHRLESPLQLPDLVPVDCQRHLVPAL